MFFVPFKAESKCLLAVIL